MCIRDSWNTAINEEDCFILHLFQESEEQTETATFAYPYFSSWFSKATQMCIRDSYSGVNYFPGNSECGFSVLLFRKWEGVQPFSSINLQSYNFQGFLLEFVGCVKHFWYIYLNQGNPQGRKIYLQAVSYTHLPTQ